MTINGYARLVGYDEKLNFQPDILESFDGRGRPHLHLQASRRPQMVRRQPADAGGFPLLAAKMCWLERGSVAGRTAHRADRRRQAAALRDRRSADRSLHLGCAESGFPAGARSGTGAQPGHAVGLSQAVPQEVSGRGQARRRWSRSTRSRSGRCCTFAWPGSIGRRIPNCRRSIPGATRPSRRPSSSSSSAIRTSTASMRTGCNCPISTR